MNSKPNSKPNGKPGPAISSLSERLPISRRQSSQEFFRLFALLASVVVVATLYIARVVLIPVALAILFSFVLTPLVAALERIRLPRTTAALLVVVLGVSALGVVGWTVGQQLVNVTEQLPNYKTNLRTKIASVRRSNQLAKASDTLRDLQRELTDGSGVAPATPLTRRQNVATDKTSGGSAGAPPQEKPIPVEVVPAANPFESVPTMLASLGTALIVVVFTFFMLLQRENLRNRFIRLVGRGRLNVMTQALDEASHRVSRYLLLQTMVNISYGAIIGTALYLIGIPNALLWGAIAGTLRFLPYIGPPLGALFPILLSLAVFQGWSRPVMTAGAFLCLEITVSNFVEPVLYGAQTGVSSIGILFAALFWTTLWGPIGLLLSTPLTVCLAVMGRYIPHLAFLQIMLGDEPVLTPEARFYQRLLAMDQEEARRILDQDLKEKQLIEIYDSVLIPALSLVEQDRHRDTLDEATERFIFQSTKELLEEQSERYSPEAGQMADASGSNGESEALASVSAPPRPSAPPCRVVCVPARDEADEIVGIMLAQLLEQAGYSAQYIAVGSVSEILDQTSREKPDIVCISALPPFALAHARTLYRKLRESAPRLTIVLGLWGHTGDTGRIAARIGMSKAEKVCATLSEVLEQVRTITETRPHHPVQDRAPEVASAGHLQ
jgi:predicted PurR-regulated permease PerM/methanogenic corrinoid protein MtbC1